MEKLTELEKEKVIACISYQAKRFESDRIAYEELVCYYDKIGRYNEKCHEEFEYARELEEFYYNLAEKLKEVL